MTMGGRDVIGFDLTQGDCPGDTASNTQAPTLPAGLEQWRNSTQPRYRGQIALQPGEVARSAVALAQGCAGQRMGFALLWHRWPIALAKPHPRREVWAVNASQDGRWIVAALGDGSVRWYRSHDGLELSWPCLSIRTANAGLSGLPRVTTTPQWGASRWWAGTSTGLLTKPRIFSVGRFRERFYQPSVVQKLLELGDETAAVRAQQQELALLERMNAAEESASKPSRCTPASRRALARPH